MNRRHIVQLGDVIERTNDRASDSGVELVLSVTEKRGIIPQSSVFNKRVAVEDLSKYKVMDPLDIAFNPYLVWAGAYGQWLGTQRGVVSPVYETFRVREGVDPRFVGILLSSGILNPYFDATAVGSIPRRRRTTVPVFLSAQFGLPEFDEQRRIIDLVGSIDSYIDSLQTQVEATRTARLALLAELLSKPGDDWQEATLGEVAEVRMGQQLSPSRRSGARPRPYLRAANIGPTGIDLNDVNLMDFSAEEEARYALLPKDILLVEGGNEKSVGCPALVSDSEKGLCFQNTLIRCRIRDLGVVVPEFLYFALLQSFVTGEFARLAQGTTILHLGQRRAEVFRVDLPPIAQQRRIVDVIGAVRGQISSLESQLDRARTFGDAVLADLLSGKRLLDESYDVRVSL